MIDFIETFLRLTDVIGSNLSGKHALQPAGQGLASAADVLVSGTLDGGTNLTASSDAGVFEGGVEVSSRATWSGSDVLSTEPGVGIEGSSLVEGLVTYSDLGSQVYRASVLNQLDESSDGSWRVGEDIANLWSAQAGGEPGSVYALAQSARVGVGVAGYYLGVHDQGSDTVEFRLNGVYPRVRRGDRIVVEVAGVGAFPARAVDVLLDQIEIQEDVLASVTKLTVDNGWFFIAQSPKDLTFWYDARKAGTIQRIPTETVTPNDILDTPRAVTLAEGSMLPTVDSDIIIQDADGVSLRARGSVDEDDPNSIIITDIDTDDFELELRKPITFLWGLSEVTRGKTVSLEVLGDGDASQPFQRFTLAESPLTYVADPDAPGGRRAELTVYVDGIAWRQAQSFYGAEPDDRIFVVQHDEDHATHIVFGDGELGSRLPTGTGNVVATYRFGVGGNVDANTIDSLVRPIKGVTEVYNPLPATGGEDPPTEREARARAIESTRVLGKLVSLPDFEVEARRWGGVVNSRAEWAWNRRADEAMVRVWIVYPQLGDPSSKLRAYLQAMAEPSTRVEITKATPRAGTLTIELDIDPRHVAADVEAAVEAHLYDPHDGLLAPRNATIASATAGNFHRSTLHAAIHEVDGVLGVKTVTFAGAPLPRVLTLDEGEYFAPRAQGQP